MNDVMTVAVSLAGFMIFFAAHVLVFRRIRQQDAVRWFFILVFIIGFGISMVSWIASILFLLLSCCYFMGMFGLMATSVRIRIMSEIARAHGITYHALLLRYNRDTIVRSRLARLVASGDIVLESGKYRSGGKITFFMAPSFVLKLMKVFYG